MAFYQVLYRRRGFNAATPLWTRKTRTDAAHPKPDHSGQGDRPETIGTRRPARLSPVSRLLVGKAECPRDAAASINRFPGVTLRSPLKESNI